MWVTKRKPKEPSDGDELLAAVQKYVESRGGKVVVLGGIELQDWDDGAFKFRIAVRCVGRKPALASDELELK